MNIHLSFSKHCWQYPILVALHEKARSSGPGVFCKKGVFENFTNQRCFPVSFQNLRNFQKHLFNRTPPVAASGKLKAEAVVRRCFVKKVFFEILLNSQENTCAKVSFLQPQECNFIKIESLTQVFSYEFCEHLSKNTFLSERIQWLLL